MTNPNKTAIQIVVDRSGSMSNIAKDMSGAIKSYLEDQAKQPGSATVSLAQFDTVYDVVYVDKNVNDAPEYTLVPQGMTALNDAIGKTVNSLGARLASLPEDERPGIVLFVIVTDGGENSSKEFKTADIKKLIDTQTNDFSWTFIYLGANQDSFLVAKDYGIPVAQTSNWVASAAGTQNLAAGLSSYTTGLRSHTPDPVLSTT